MPGVLTLIARRRKTVVFVALLALFLAQAVAQLHAYKHFGDGSDAPAPAGQHSQYCPDCLSHAPLLVMLGSAGTALFVAALIGTAILVASEPSRAGRDTPRAFSARAPPLSA